MSSEGLLGDKQGLGNWEESPGTVVRVVTARMAPGLDNYARGPCEAPWTFLTRWVVAKC